MASSASSFAERTVRLRSILSALILIALTPPLCLLAMSILRAGAADRANSNAQFLTQARTMASMFGSSLEANMSVVAAIAGRTDTDEGRIEHLHGIGTFFSADFATDRPNPAYPAVPAQPGSWIMSNLIDIEQGKQARLAITINTSPEGTSGTERLTLVMEPRQLTRALRFDAAAYGDTLVAVVDGNGRIISRSRDEERFIGARVPTWDALLAVGAPSGVFNAQLLDGDSITFAFSTIAGTPGWVVVAGVPTAIFDSRWREPLVFLAGGSIIAVLAGIVLALIVAHRIAQPLTALADFAEASTDAPTPPPASPITEYAALRRALLDAHAKLTDRANRLALSEDRYRALARVGAIVTWRRSVDGPLLELDGWEDLTGAPAAPLLGNGWANAIHPDDLPDVEATWQEAFATDRAIDFECRVVLANKDWLWIRARGVCLRDTTGTATEWVGTIENINERKQRQLRDNHMAFHDELTGLPNRGLLRERLDQALAAAQQETISALLYVDLDYFKRANDTYGHAAGDALLRLVADRIAAQLRPSDTPARLGGDEFAVVLHDISHVDTAVATGLRLVRALSLPFDLGDVTIHIGASVGIALIISSTSAQEVMRQADMALYEAKGEGRGRCIVYSASGRERLSA